MGNNKEAKVEPKRIFCTLELWLFRPQPWGWRGPHLRLAHELNLARPLQGCSSFIFFGLPSIPKPNSPVRLPQRFTILFALCSSVSFCGRTTHGDGNSSERVSWFGFYNPAHLPTVVFILAFRPWKHVFCFLFFVLEISIKYHYGWAWGRHGTE